MGQINGTICIDERAKPFVNLPARFVKDLIEAFHLISEDFHISLTEMNEIFRISIRQCYACEDDQFSQSARRFFCLFDCEGTNVIDSFELLSAFILTSDMDLKEKVKEVIHLYDFDKEDQYNINEVTLSLRSSVYALCKIANLEKPDDGRIDFYASLLFPSNHFQGFQQNYYYLTMKIDLKEVVEMVTSLPEIMSWLKIFNNLSEVDGSSSSKRAKFLSTDRSLLVDPCLGPSKTESVNYFEQMVQAVGSLNKVGNASFTSIPQISIELSWIYGRNTRNMPPNSSFYTSNGAIVYPAGATVVNFQMTNSDNAFQQFYMRHKNYVTCLALSSHEDKTNGQIIASSEQSSKPIIYIWSSLTMHTLQCIKGFHSDGVQSLDFSPSGNLLLTRGMDVNNSIAIYDWRENHILYTTTIGSKLVTDCKFLGADTKFGICGDSFVHIWEAECNSFKDYERKIGLFGKYFKIQMMTCMVFVSGQIVTGGADGRIYLWEGRSCVRALATLRVKTAIKTMNVSSLNHLCAATVDGLLLIYDNELELKMTYRVQHLVPNGSYCINTLSWGQGTILVGTASSDLLELRLCDGKLLNKITKGYTQKDSIRLSANPVDANEMVSVGDDGLLRLLNLQNSSEINVTYLGSSVSCVDYNSSGNLIVVGLDGLNSGVFLVLCKESLSIKIKARPCNQVLNDCKHSKDGKFAAFASSNHFIYIYDAAEYNMIARASGHTSPVTHIDFGYFPDGDAISCIRSNSLNGEIMFWNLEGKRVTPISQRTQSFETCSCPLTWDMMGTQKSKGMDQIEVCDKSNKGNIVAVATRSGAIKLFGFPSLQKNQIHSKVLGHGGPIGSIKFSKDDKYLMTSGRFDCCMMQWKYKMIGNGSQCLEAVTSNNSTIIRHTSLDDSTEPMAKSMSSVLKGPNSEKPCRTSWKKSIVPPSDPYISNKVKSPGPFLLEWIFGYNGKIRKGIHYLNSNEIIYPVGKKLVAFNKMKHKQCIYQEATGVITSLAINPARNVCAIGNGDGIGDIMCLNCDTMQTIRILEGSNGTNVSLLDFNQKGNLLLSIADDEFHTLTIYDWNLQSCPIISSHTSVLPIYDVIFTSFDKILMAGEEVFCLCTIQQGKISVEDLIFDNELKIQSFHSIVSQSNGVIVGTGDGRLCIFNDCHVITTVADACDAKSPILCVTSVTNGVISGSKYGRIKMWDDRLSCLMDFGLINSETRSIDFIPTTHAVLIGTSSNAIYEISLLSKHDNFNDAVILESVSGKALAGTAVAPCKSVIASTSNDKTFNLWDVKEKKRIWSLVFDTPSTCCAFSPTGSLIAVGFGCPTKMFALETPGKWIVLDATTSSMIFEHRPSRKMITTIKWSEKYVAVGSNDCKVYLYAIDSSDAERFQASLICTINQHYAPIVNIDFSIDSQFLKINCEHNLYFFKVVDGSHIGEVSKLRDVKWTSHSCYFSWDAQGLWSCCKGDTHVQCTDSIVDDECNLTVSGFSNGHLGLFHYPCINDKNPYQTITAHHQRVGWVHWIDNSKFISTGIDDNSMMLWTRSNAHEQKPEEPQRELSFPTEVEFSDENALEKDNTHLKECWAIERQNRPWKATVIEPDSNQKDTSNLEYDISLEDICGLEGQFLESVNQNEIVTSEGSTFIVNNVSNNQQAYFRGHKNMISCVALSSSHLIASGDRGSQASIRIWDVNTCKEIKCLDLLHCNGTRHLTFTDSNNFLISIGEDEKNCVTIWKSLSSEWYDGVFYIKGQTGLSVPHFLFSIDCSNYFATGEDDGVTFWDYKMHHTLIPTKGAISHENDRQPMLCCTSCDDVIVTGSNNGNLYQWVDKVLSTKMKGHETAIICLLKFRNGIVSGSRDGIIQIWNCGFVKVMKFNIKQHLGLNSDVLHSLHSISCYRNEKCNNLFVGVKNNGIYEISIKTSNITCFKEAHKNRVCDAAFHPLNKNQFVTCDDGGMLRFWDHIDGNVKKRFVLNSKMTCLDWSNDGTELLVGCDMSHHEESELNESFACFILNVNSLEVKWKGKECKASITHVKYGPNSTMFALVDKLNKIYVYDNKDRCQSFKPRLKLVTDIHKAPITSIDFSKDSYYIQSSSADYELIRFNTDDGQIMNLPSQIKNIIWDTYSCPFGWHVQGLWKPVSESHGSPEPTCISRSNDYKLLAVGFSNGEVRLYSYPCSSYHAPYRVQKLHLGPVSRCSFNSITTLLVTVGNEENGVVTWSLHKDL